jgi:DNA-binding NarL/FixJ family response regulator
MKARHRITVLIADDHFIVREGLRSTLRKYSYLQIIGEAANGLEAVEQVKELAPEVVLMDINMPRLNGLKATAEIRARYPKTKVLVITVHDSRQYVVQIFQAGAHGYVSKDAAPDELARAIRTVSEGGVSLSPGVAQLLTEDPARAASAAPPSAPLSEREKQIVNCLISGLTSKEIAAELKLSVRTVETFRLRLLRKYKVNNAAQLTRYVLENQLLQPATR